VLEKISIMHPVVRFIWIFKALWKNKKAAEIFVLHSPFAVLMTV